MPEVRIYGAWERRVKFEFGKGRHGYTVVLTKVPNNELGMSYVMRLGRRQTAESVIAKAAALNTSNIRVSVRAHDANHVLIILRDGRVGERVRHVQGVYDTSTTLTGALAIPIFHELAKAAEVIALNKAIGDAINEFLPLVRSAME